MTEFLTVLLMPLGISLLVGAGVAWYAYRYV